MGKVKSSAFWWFMRHLQEQEFKASGRSPSMSEVSGKAGNLWKTMTPEEKKPFIDKHEAYKKGPRLPLSDFSGSNRLGRDMRQNIKEDPDGPSNGRNYVDNQSRQKKTIKALSKFIAESSVDKILTTRFYVIASNVMCATRKEVSFEDCVTEDTYYPLEIGIVAFTVAEGIIYENNVYVDPGQIPPNMARICHDHFNKHLIPLSDFAYSIGCCKDPKTQKYISGERRVEFDRLISDIHDNITPSIIDDIQETPEKPCKLLFCQADQTFQNKGVLKFIGKEAGHDNFADDIEIVNVAELFYFLCRKKGDLVKALILDVLECSKFNYDGRCEFHSTTETSNCAIAVAKKYCWLMFERLSNLYSFELTAKHKPAGEKPKPIDSSEDKWRELGSNWEAIAVPRTSVKRRYFDEGLDEPMPRPVKASDTVIWTESLGRGKTRVSGHPDAPSPASSSPTTVYNSTDIRIRNGTLKNETESTPGPSRLDPRPRLPGREPVDSSQAFAPATSEVEDMRKPAVSSASNSNSDLPRALGRGRGRKNWSDELAK